MRSRLEKRARELANRLQIRLHDKGGGSDILNSAPSIRKADDTGTCMSKGAS